MELAYVDKVAKDNNIVKSLLVRLYLFHKSVDSKGLKTKDSKETATAFLAMITKKHRFKKFWNNKGTEFARDFRKNCKVQGIQV